MPKLRDATAPNTSPIPTVRRIAATSASVGSQPSRRPFVSPPGSRFVTMFASA